MSSAKAPMMHLQSWCTRVSRSVSLSGPCSESCIHECGMLLQRRRTWRRPATACWQACPRWWRRTTSFRARRRRCSPPCPAAASPPPRCACLILSSSCRGNGVFTSAWCLASSLRLFACRTGPSLHARDALCHTLQLQYSAWLDQHSSAEALRSIKAAIEASPAAAREEAEVVPLMLRLCSGGG